MTDRVGQQLGNYHLSRLLGSGGFADVYLGEHVYLKTQAAVKVLQTRLSAPEDLESFLTEARTVARLSHPNIVRILDFGVDNETPFLVMDYAPNGTLRQRHPRGVPLPLSTVTQYVRQLANALQHAHDEKLIHRDVKPENMLIGRRNEILLSDFGIALVAQSSRYQNTQDVVGTVAYMSPEQIQGKPRAASDQYALGISVYEWLSGVRPFNGSFTELCTQHMFAPVPPLREKVATLSQDVELVVSTALAKEPKQRFGSVQAFATALEHASQSPVGPDRSVPTLTTTVPAPPFAPLPAVQPVVTPPVQQTPPVSPRPYASSPGTPGAGTFLIGGTGVRVWGLNKTQLLSMLVGTLLYLLVTFALDKLFLINIADYTDGNLLLSPIGGQLFLPSLIGILSGASLIIPLFFGARFGPWVGVGVALVGVFLGDALSGYLGAESSLWLSYLAWLFLGFIAGLGYVKTQGFYSFPESVRFGVLMGLCAIVINTLIQSIVYTVGFPGLSFLNEFLSTLLSNLFALLLLSVVLIISGRVSDRR